MKKLNVSQHIIKWNVVDEFDVSAIMTTRGFSKQQVRDLVSEYKRKQKVDIQSFQQWMMNEHCLSNSQECYITYK